MWASMIVAFIAGYSVVSFLVRKVKNARDRYPVEPPRHEDDQDPFR